MGEGVRVRGGGKGDGCRGKAEGGRGRGEGREDREKLRQVHKVMVKDHTCCTNITTTNFNVSPQQKSRTPV